MKIASIKLLLILLSAVSFAQKFKSTEVSSQIVNVEVLPVVNKISLISGGNKLVLDDSLSAVANVALKKIINVNLERLKVGGVYNEEELDTVKHEKAIFALFNNILKNKKLDSVKIPEAFKTLYGGKLGYKLVIFQRGFTREKGNFGKQVGKSLATGILTLGMAYSVPIKYNSSIYACIVNNETDKVSFFNYSVLQIDPLNQEELQKQYLKLFDKYFN